MTFPDVTDVFTINPDPPRGGKYVVFCKNDTHTTDPSPYDRVQFFTFTKPPNGSFHDDPMFDGTTFWLLMDSIIVDVFMANRDDLPMLTVVEVVGCYCRLEQIGGERRVAFKDLWLSREMLRRAVEHGTLRRLS